LYDSLLNIIIHLDIYHMKNHHTRDVMNAFFSVISAKHALSLS